MLQFYLVLALKLAPNVSVHTPIVLALIPMVLYSASFILSNLVRDGRLLRTWKASDDGGEAKLNAYLEDYSYLTDALITLYEATFEQRWMDEAVRWADAMVELFWSDEEGVFYDTGTDHEMLVVRPRDVFDNAIPSGGAVAALALMKLSIFTGNDDYRHKAVRSLGSVREFMERSPGGFSHWLSALDFHLARVQEVVIAGPPEDAATMSLIRTARADFGPNRVFAGTAGPVEGDDWPLLAGRALVNGIPTAYVCENYACQLPVTESAALAKQLESNATA